MCKPENRRKKMSGRSDIAKGRVKEATGVLTDNRKLQERGRTDQSIGRVKQAAAKATDKITKKMRG
jgi:uncharacterized protein YjbJ (UPF0337 family)